MAFIAILYAGAFGTFGYYMLYQYAIKYGSPLIASMILYIQPIATIVWAFALLGEQLTIYFIAGAILVFIGAWIVTYFKHRTKRI